MAASKRDSVAFNEGGRNLTPPSLPVNPYCFAGPIRDPAQFYGRQRQLWDIFDSIRKRVCVNIVGERRSGKTSLLLHLLADQIREQYDASSRDRVYVFLDTQIMSREPAGFFEEAFRLAQASCPDLPMEMRQLPLNEAHVRAALNAMGDHHLILLVDEFEEIASNAKFTPDFFVFLRGLCIHYPLTLVVATRRRLADCCPPETRTSGFHNIFKTVEIGAFEPAELDDFLARTSAISGLSLGEHRSKIISLAGYYPYFVQIACHYCFTTWMERGGLDAEAWSEICYRFESEVRPFLTSMWEHYLSEKQRQALWLLAQGSKDVKRAVVWELQQKGYVTEGRISSEVLADFVRQQRSAPKADQPTPELPPPQSDKGLWLDKDSGNVYLNGKVLDPPLTKHQYRLLKLLWDNADKICDPYEIARAVWAEDYSTEEEQRVIDSVDDQRIAQLVTRLRRRIEPEGKPWKYIITVHGRGLTLGSGNPKT